MVDRRPSRPKPAVTRSSDITSSLEQADISMDAALSKTASTLSVLKGMDKEKKIFFYGGGGVLLVFLVLLVFSCQPAKGSIVFAVCSAFLELNTPYPHTLDYKEVEWSNWAVRIYFTSTDPFGSYRLEMLQCSFTPDEKMGFRVQGIERNREPVDQKIIDDFNKTLPSIAAGDPYLVLPPNWKNPLLDR
jgi:hypothetical protein